MLKQILALSSLLLVCFSCTNNKTGSTTIVQEDIQTQNDLYLLVGTYTAKDSKGIYVYKFDTVTGSSKYVSDVFIQNPSYLTLSNDEKNVYVVSENGDRTASASSFSFDKENGILKKMNQELTGGKDPCYITLSPDNKFAATANYSSGSITIFPINEKKELEKASSLISFTGHGVDKDRQTQPHLHFLIFSPDNKYLFANDLGTDQIHKFDLTQDSTFIRTSTEPAIKLKDGIGPRHSVFHPNGKYMYTITELSGEVLVFDYKDETLIQKQSILSDSLHVKGSADIHISPDGKYLYASNRLQGDGISIFSINENDGTLSKVGYQATGSHPRNFIITPNGNFLLVANRDSDNIQVFVRNKNTGLLEDTKQNIELSMPVCLKFASTK